MEEVEEVEVEVHLAEEMELKELAWPPRFPQHQLGSRSRPAIGSSAMTAAAQRCRVGRRQGPKRAYRPL